MLDACCLDGGLGLVDARLDLGWEGMISFMFRRGRGVQRMMQLKEREGEIGWDLGEDVQRSR